MAVRNDLCLTIMVTYFQDFDRGNEITQRVPKRWNVENDDMIRWECAQFSGHALVVGCFAEGDELELTLKQID